METFSSSVSSLKATSLPSVRRREHLHHFKAPVSNSIKSHHLCATKRSSISRRPSSPLAQRNSDFPSRSPLPQASSIKLRAPSWTHGDATTGYAAALINAAQSNGSLEKTLDQVQRLLKFLGTEQTRAVFEDPFVGDEVKGRIVKEAAERAKFGKYMMGLMKILIEKRIVGILTEVLIEFERIYDEMVGTKVIRVSSRRKMVDDELCRMARTAKGHGGNVKVEARNLVDEGLSYGFVS